VQQQQHGPVRVRYEHLRPVVRGMVLDLAADEVDDATWRRDYAPRLVRAGFAHMDRAALLQTLSEVSHDASHRFSERDEARTLYERLRTDGAPISRPFACRGCPRTFTTSNNLRRHLTKAQHGRVFYLAEVVDPLLLPARAAEISGEEASNDSHKDTPVVPDLVSSVPSQ